MVLKARYCVYQTPFQPRPSWRVRRAIATWIITNRIVETLADEDVAPPTVLLDEDQCNIIKLESKEEINVRLSKSCGTGFRYDGLYLLHAKAKGGQCWSDVLHRIEVPGDGSCLYHCLAVFANIHAIKNRRNWSALSIKSCIQEGVVLLWDQIFPDSEMTYSLLFTHVENVDTYVERMKGGWYGGAFECAVFSAMAQCDVFIVCDLGGESTPLVTTSMPHPKKKIQQRLLLRHVPHTNKALEHYTILVDSPSLVRVAQQIS